MERHEDRTQVRVELPRWLVPHVERTALQQGLTVAEYLVELACVDHEDLGLDGEAEHHLGGPAVLPHEGPDLGLEVDHDLRQD